MADSSKNPASRKQIILCGHTYMSEAVVTILIGNNSEYTNVCYQSPNRYGYINLKLHNKSQATEYGLIQLTDLDYQRKKMDIPTGCIW
jgi:hypothetical protein